MEAENKVDADMHGDGQGQPAPDPPKYTPTPGTRPVPGITAVRSVYHGGTTLLRSAARCRVRRWVRSYAAAAAATAAAGDVRQWQPVACHPQVVLLCHSLLLFRLLVLQSSFRLHRFFAGL